MKALTLVLIGLLASTAPAQLSLPPREVHDLVFVEPPSRPIDGLPLGNGTLQCNVWGEEDLLLALDHTGLWDLRASPAFEGNAFRFETLLEGLRSDDHTAIAAQVEKPARFDPTPTKLPLGQLRLSFEEAVVGTSRLSLSQGTARLQLEGLGEIEVFVHAEQPIGRVRVRGTTRVNVALDAPPFGPGASDDTLPHDDLRRLGYPEPELDSDKNWIWYRQETWNGARHAVVATWRDVDEQEWELLWTVVLSEEEDPIEVAMQRLQTELGASFDVEQRRHAEWWREYWNRSGIRLPDGERALEAQWYRTQYFYGCVARRGAPPLIGNGARELEGTRLPPDKGTYSSWMTPACHRFACAANRPEGLQALRDSYTTLLAAARDWTRRFYGLPPGVNQVNLPARHAPDATPVGGPPAHAFSATAGCSLALLFAEAHAHFPEDDGFGAGLFSFVREIAEFIEGQLTTDADGRTCLPLSSSPELGEAAKGFFLDTLTNYDLALIRGTLRFATDLADELGRAALATRWRALERSLPDWATDPDLGGMLVAPGVPLPHSHRRLSHLAAIHPLGLIQVDDGDAARALIEASVADLDEHGVEAWIGSTFADRAALAACAGHGDEAARYLKLFTDHFCSLNGMHAGGDQSDRGYSRFRARAPSLDGNARFADGLQSMLLRSHDGVVRLCPAIPANWLDIEFSSLRTRGGFLVSVVRIDGSFERVTVRSEYGGKFRLEDPFDGAASLISGDTYEQLWFTQDEVNGQIEFETEADKSYVLRLD